MNTHTGSLVEKDCDRPSFVVTTKLLAHNLIILRVALYGRTARITTYYTLFLFPYRFKFTVDLDLKARLEASVLAGEHQSFRPARTPNASVVSDILP